MQSILKFKFFLIFVVTLLQMTPDPVLIAGQIPKGDYFGQKPPDLKAQVFAPGIISLKNRYEYSITFSADGNECCFGVTNSDWSWCDIYYLKQDEQGNWSGPQKAYFQKENDGWQPFFTPKGNRLYFSSGRPDKKSVNIYVCEKNNNRWGDPLKLAPPVNSPAWEWRPTTTADGRLFFMSNRDRSLQGENIYFALPKGKGFDRLTNLGPPVDSKAFEASPFISPDGKYLLLECRKPGGFGQADNYISYKKDTGGWTVPQNLGAELNTDQIEDGGYVSPDGKYFFFNRRKAWVTQVDSDILWVDSRVIFRPYVSVNEIKVRIKKAKSFIYTIPAGIFADYDDPELKYSAELSSGKPLPDWLKFDDSTLNFFGIPSEEGETLKVRVSARDRINSKVDLDIIFMIAAGDR
jgi:hypothetical protein